MGAHVVLCARKKERCEAAAAELRSLGVKAMALGCDVKDPASVKAVVDATVAEFGRVDILINNAGTSWGAPVEEMRLEHWNKVIQTNLTGTFLFSQAAGNVMTGSEQVLLEDWCTQFPSHTVGTVRFGPDGALYVGGGEGANFNTVDYGQFGSPLNPCGDPPGGVGATLSPPTAAGGALRAQHVQTPNVAPGYDGAILRVDPNSGAALANLRLVAEKDGRPATIQARAPNTGKTRVSLWAKILGRRPETKPAATVLDPDAPANGAQANAAAADTLVKK